MVDETQALVLGLWDEAPYRHLVAAGLTEVCPPGPRPHTHLIIVSGIPQKPTKGDCVGDAAEVDEQDGRDGLDVEAIVEVTWEPGQLPLDIQMQATEEPAQDRPRGCFLPTNTSAGAGVFYRSCRIGRGRELD